MLAHRHCIRLPVVVVVGCGAGGGGYGVDGADDAIVEAGGAGFLASAEYPEGSERVDDPIPRGSMGPELGGRGQSSRKWGGVTAVHRCATLLANERTQPKYDHEHAAPVAPPRVSRWASKGSLEAETEILGYGVVDHMP